MNRRKKEEARASALFRDAFTASSLRQGANGRSLISTELIYPIYNERVLIADKSRMDESTDNLVKLETLLEGFYSDGNYMHGYVTDEISVHQAVEIFRRITATTFSVRTSTPLNFEPSKVEKGKFTTRSIKFTKSSCPNLNEDGVPFMHGGRKILECQFGPKREHEKKMEKDGSATMPGLQTLEEMEHDYTPACGPAAKRKRLNTRGTRKKGCQARISIVQVCRFPEYAVISKKCISIQQIQLKERLLQDLHDEREVKVENRFYIDLPLDNAHSKHPAAALSGMVQTVHPQIIQWIDQLVGEGVTKATEMQGKLRHLVNTRMSDTAAPSSQDRGYYPKLQDIKNHIYRAKVRRRMTNPGSEDIAELDQDDDIKEPQCEPDNCDDIYAEVLVLRQQIGDLSRVYSCLSPNACWDRLQHPPVTLTRTNRAQVVPTTRGPSGGRGRSCSWSWRFSGTWCTSAPACPCCRG